MSSNPFTDYYQSLGLAGMNNPNPYLEFTGQIPLAGYQGAPTDAMGQPIQSYQPPAPGTTLNSTPAAAPAPQRPQGMTDQQALVLAQQLGGSGVQGSGRGTTGGQGIMDVYNQLMAGQGQTDPNSAARIQYMMSGGQGPPPNPNAAGGAGTGAAGTPAPQAADARQAYLSALANPGPVTTPGAVMQPGATPTGSPPPSVLAHFLATQSGKTGAGGYSNMPFFNTLNQLQAAKAGAS